MVAILPFVGKILHLNDLPESFGNFNFVDASSDVMNNCSFLNKNAKSGAA